MYMDISISILHQVLTRIEVLLTSVFDMITLSRVGRLLLFLFWPNYEGPVISGFSTSVGKAPYVESNMQSGLIGGHGFGERLCNLELLEMQEQERAYIR